MRGVTTKDQPSQLASCSGEDAAWCSEEGSPHPTTQMAWPCCSDVWLKKLQKVSPGRGRGRGSPKKTWSEVIRLDWLALALNRPSVMKAWYCTLKNAIDRAHPYTRHSLGPVNSDDGNDDGYRHFKTNWIGICCPLILWRKSILVDLHTYGVVQYTSC